MKGLAEAVVVRSMPVEGRVVSWRSRSSAFGVNLLKRSFGLETRFVWWWVVEVRLVVAWWAVVSFVIWSAVVSIMRSTLVIV